MSQRGTVQLLSRRRNTVKKLNLSHVTTHAFTLAQWLNRCSSVQAAYSPSSPTASKSDDKQSKFYTPFYSDRIKQELHMQSQSIKSKCKEKKVETGTLQELCYIYLGNTEICWDSMHNLFISHKMPFISQFHFFGSHYIDFVCKQLLKFKYPNKKTWLHSSN